MVGAIGSNCDLGSVSEETPESRAQVRKSVLLGVPSVREDEFVDIEVA